MHLLADVRDPTGVLVKAHNAVKVPGSATACVMQIDHNTRVAQIVRSLLSCWHMYWHDCARRP